MARYYQQRRTYDFNNLSVSGFNTQALEQTEGAGFSVFHVIFFFMFTPMIVFSGLFSFAAVFLVINAIRKRNDSLRRRENAVRYYNLLRTRESFTVDEVAYYLNMPRAQVQSDLQFLFDNGIIQLKPDSIVYPSPRENRTAYDKGKMYSNPQYTVEKVNTNYKEQQNVSSLRTYNRPQQQTQQTEQKAQQQAPVRKTGGDSSLYTDTVNYIKKIREANEAIPGESMTAKIDELEKVTINIYNATVENPDLLKKTKKFMSYYLPTTEKLIEKYAELDRKSIQTENTNAIKARIEESLDSITKAFYELYNSLYDYDAIDITSEIEAFKNTLVNDGLLDNGLQIEIPVMEKEEEKV